MPRHKFVLNDETKVNQFGFRVKNSGLDLARLKANPVVLDGHINSNWAVIGRLEDFSYEGPLLTAYVVFDEEDPRAKEIAGKVERGFLRGCSLGLDPFNMSNFVEAPDGVYDLIKSEALELSIVAIPNNANALNVKLYAATENNIRELLSNEVSEILLSAGEISKFINHNTMKKILLTLNAVQALGLPGNTLEHEENLVNEKIVNLKSELDKSNEMIEGFKQLEADKRAKLSADTVDADIKAGKIDATKREEYIKLHSEFPDLYKSTVALLPSKTNLSGKVVPAAALEIKTLDEFQKLDLNAQLEFKTTQPEQYKALFK
jgi:hypothetical protein